MTTVKGQEISSAPESGGMNALEVMLRLSLLRGELVRIADVARGETATIIRYAVRVLGLIRDAKGRDQVARRSSEKPLP